MDGVEGSQDGGVEASGRFEVSRGDLELPAPPDRWVPEKLADGSMTPLPIEMSHVLAVASLPRLHLDPFDRLLVAQARLLGVPVVSGDAVFAS